MTRSSMKLLAICALLVALPVAAFAQTSRVAGMGIQGDFIKDYSNIYTYTSQVSNVGSLVFGELGDEDADNRGVGAVLGNIAEGRFGTWAITIRDMNAQLGTPWSDIQPGPGTPDGGHDPNEGRNESLALMWGMKFGTTSLGARIDRTFWNREVTGAGEAEGLGNRDRNIIGVGFGAGFEMSPEMTAEANLLWQNRTFDFKNAAGTSLVSDDGGTALQVAGRMLWQAAPNVLVVPMFKFSSWDLSTKTPGSTTENKESAWQAGLAGNWTVGANDLVVLGATFAQNKIEPGTDEFTQTFAPLVFAALETNVNPWLTLRFGASKSVMRTDKEVDGTDTDETKSSDDFSMSLGAGVKVGPLQLDAVVNDSFPQNMPYLVSGSSTNPMFTRVTATFPF